MIPKDYRIQAACAALWLSATCVVAQQEDVTFFVIGKHASYRQAANGVPTLVDHSFFSEIFLASGGDARNASLTLPTGATVAFRDQRGAEGSERDNLLEVSGRERYARLADLQADYPDGDYRITFDTPAGSVRDARLSFPGGELPAAPRIRISQDGKPVCEVVDPARALEVRWSAFTQGGPDPNGILDDLVFVILADPEGRRLAHSGRPFENRPFLTFANDMYIVPADRMQSGHEYRLSVEHAILDDTRRYNGIPAMTTRAVTTTIEIKTAEETEDLDSNCGPDR